MGFPSPEITPHFKNMINYHQSVDDSLPDGVTVFIGDSITQGLATAAVSELSVNYGIGSDTTVGVLERLPIYNSMETAKAIVIAIGVNDLSRRENHVILENYDNILKRIPPQTNVVVSAVHPIDEKFASVKAKNSRIRELNTSLEMLAEKYQNTIFTNSATKMGDIDGNLLPEYHIGDGVHLSSEGYEVWISKLKASLARI